MSANPQAMAQMLAAGLGGQGQQPGQQQSPLGTAASLAQKIMLMKALQQGQPPQVNPMVNPQMLNPQVQNANPIPGVGVNA